MELEKNRTAQKRCFVISPIGAEGSEVRKHANNVFKYIIKRAMDQCSVNVFRSDHLHESGKISDQMFGAILNEDLCVAVLTFYNPNVFYELAIAQAAARPVIIMLQKGETLPFDIRDLRCVYYDFDPEPLVEGHYVNELVNHIKALEAAEWKAPNIFGNLSPLGAGSSYFQSYKFHAKADDFGSPDDWLALFQEATTSFDIMGFTLGSWRRAKGFTEALLNKVANGCKVRVLLMDHENPCFLHLLNDAIEEIDVRHVLREAESMYEFFLKLAARDTSIQVRRIKRGCPHFQTTSTDRRAVFIQYLFSRKTGWSPLWDCDYRSDLYKIVAEEFDLLWQANAPDEPKFRHDPA